LFFYYIKYKKNCTYLFVNAFNEAHIDKKINKNTKEETNEYNKSFFCSVIYRIKCITIQLHDRINSFKMHNAKVEEEKKIKASIIKQNYS
jgi:hypothetical protein